MREGFQVETLTPDANRRGPMACSAGTGAGHQPGASGKVQDDGSVTSNPKVNGKPSLTLTNHKIEGSKPPFVEEYLCYFMFSPVGFKGSLSLLEICSHFFQGSQKQMEVNGKPSRTLTKHKVEKLNH